ncbi:hypothetical protein [uncultured Abyssibacter sp.]|uniref:hypothetical protein n=1 Tax=uncultured Abyssibacter sp. TaxID=2320202 RepID=UPI0032B307F8|tara:strand:+ start:99 stop:554 length:456 start_codon:yes stop_codon:yes gene_type:complete
MTKLTNQSEGNHAREAGMFYPTGHLVIGFDHQGDADTAHDHLQKAGFPEDDITVVPAKQMEAEAAKNLEHPNLMSSLGSSLPVREKQLQLAQKGCEFVMVLADSDDKEEQAIQAVSHLPVRYAVKYRKLVIEDLRARIDSTESHSDPARVP